MVSGVLQPKAECPDTSNGSWGLARGSGDFQEGREGDPPSLGTEEHEDQVRSLWGGGRWLFVRDSFSCPCPGEGS